MGSNVALVSADKWCQWCIWGNSEVAISNCFCCWHSWKWNRQSFFSKNSSGFQLPKCEWSTKACADFNGVYQLLTSLESGKMPSVEPSCVCANQFELCPWRGSMKLNSSTVQKAWVFSIAHAGQFVQKLIFIFLWHPISILCSTSLGWFSFSVGRNWRWASHGSVLVIVWR